MSRRKVNKFWCTMTVEIAKTFPFRQLVRKKERVLRRAQRFVGPLRFFSISMTKVDEVSFRLIDHLATIAYDVLPFQYPPSDFPDYREGVATSTTSLSRPIIPSFQPQATHDVPSRTNFELPIQQRAQCTDRKIRREYDLCSGRVRSKQTLKATTAPNVESSCPV